MYFPVRAVITRRQSIWLMTAIGLLGLVKIFQILELSSQTYLTGLPAAEIIDNHLSEENLSYNKKVKETEVYAANEVLHENRDSIAGRVNSLTQSGRILDERILQDPGSEHKDIPPTDDPQIFPYRYLINEINACDNMTRIINIVPSATSSAGSRGMIRSLWGNEKYRSITEMKTMFLVAVPPTDNLQQVIDLESMTYHDIIQLDFLDSYLNLTLKTLSMLHWTMNYCSTARWILKSDEDVFVNPFALRNFLAYAGTNTTFVCKLNVNVSPCRYEKDCSNPKWVVSKYLYPYATYPPYCNGPAYVIKRSMASKLFRAANKTHVFPLEDAYFTGILAEELELKYTQLSIRRFPTKFRRLEPDHWNGFSLFLLNVERVKGNTYVLWKKILELNNLTVSNDRN